MRELAAWLEGQTAVDRVEGAAAELARRGLIVLGAARTKRPAAAFSEIARSPPFSFT